MTRERAQLSPFDYYLEMIAEVLKSGRAYDCIPNFTAADIVRLLGIGRNQYIEIVNRFRSKGWLKKLRGRSIFDELPSHPVEGHIEYWWRVQPAHVSPEEFKKCGVLQQEMISTIAAKASRLDGGVEAGLLDRTILHQLYCKGLVRLSHGLTDQFRRMHACTNARTHMRARIMFLYYVIIMHVIFTRTLHTNTQHV
jgi:hypothetical protein